MKKNVVIAGGGIGGMATAIACARVGWPVTLLERAPAFSEVGAGLQLGPNATTILDHWGLGAAMRRVAAFPDQLLVRSALDGQVLGRLPLGADIQAKYGSPYATFHRADLHDLLTMGASALDKVHLKLSTTITGYTTEDDCIEVHTEGGPNVRGDLLVAADGVWSRLRQLVLNDGSAQPTGYWAFRSTIDQDRLPPALRSQSVTAWLGPKMHAVQYPIKGGSQMNFVLVVERHRPDDEPYRWDAEADLDDARSQVTGCCTTLQDTANAMPHWGRWVLCGRTPMSGPHEMGRDRVALLGDAAHPLVPYLAQGAAMALEDAMVLSMQLYDPQQTVAQAIEAYAAKRWARASKVQARSLRNGKIFHASGLHRRARDLAMATLGAKLLDQPWLYKGIAPS